jgi:hypothetical protein
MSYKRSLLMIGGGVVAIILLVTLFVTFAVKKVHVVDSRPAIAVGEMYFAAMKENGSQKAFELFSREFREKQGDLWKDFLVRMPESFGSITRYSITQGAVVPVSNLGCYGLRYSVERTKVNSDEKFIVCPANGTSWAIVGHELTRTDTGQTVSAGIINRQIGVHVP